MKMVVARGRVLWLMTVVALLALVTACGGSPEGGPDETESPAEASEGSEPAKDEPRRVRAKVHAEGTGAAVFSWDGEQEVLITRVGGPEISVNLLSAGFEVPEKITEDPSLRFRWAFDLLNAYEDKPGTFQITADAVNPQGLKSSAFLIWMKVKDPTKDAVFEMSEVHFLKEFNQAQEPCTLVIGENANSGSLRCPALATKDGEVAGLTVTWEEIPE